MPSTTERVISSSEIPLISILYNNIEGILNFFSWTTLVAVPAACRTLSNVKSADFPNPTNRILFGTIFLSVGIIVVSFSFPVKSPFFSKPDMAPPDALLRAFNSEGIFFVFSKRLIMITSVDTFSAALNVADNFI